MSLLSDKHGVPTWKKLKEISQSYNNVTFHEGVDGTGDILKRENQEYLFEHCRGCDFVTGDGGFDFTENFINMENDMFPLILAQTLIALKILYRKGIFIVKMFDISTKPMIQLL